jgi:hypothetical protein
MSRIQFLFLLFIAIVFEIVYCTRLLQFSGVNFLIHTRGGAKSISSSRKFTPSKFKTQKRKFETHDDDDDNDDEDEEHTGRNQNRHKQSSKTSRNYPKHKQQKSFFLIPWGNKVRKGRKSQSSGFSINDKFRQLAKAGQSAYKEIYRRAKVCYFIS